MKANIFYQVALSNVVKTKSVKIASIIVICLILSDLLLQITYQIFKGRSTWDTIFKYESFTIDFLEPVKDERYLKPIKSYADNDIEFNRYGFRKGLYASSDSVKNIVFLGDSVFFGINLNANETIPSRFALEYVNKTNRKPYLINASLPSFSLDQLIHKYIYEVKDKFPIEGIILQAYDPAENFYLLKSDWNVDRNWYTGGRINRSAGYIKKFTNSPLKYSSIFYLYWRFSGAYFTIRHLYGKYSKEDKSRYVSSIRNSLDKLTTNTDGVRFILLLPITRPKSAYSALKAAEREPIDILNEELKSYSAKFEKIHFLDTIALLNRHREDEVFMDYCCHLTAKGSQIVAEYLFSEMKRLNLL